MTAADAQATRVCAITGDNDEYAPHAQISSLLGVYAKKDGTDGVHIIPGLTHTLSKEHTELGLAFLKSCGCE